MNKQKKRFHEKLVTRAIIIIIALEGDNLLSKIIIALVVKSLLPCRAIIIIIALVM